MVFDMVETPGMPGRPSTPSMSRPKQPWKAMLCTVTTLAAPPS